MRWGKKVKKEKNSFPLSEKSKLIQRKIAPDWTSMISADRGKPLEGNEFSFSGKKWEENDREKM